MKNLFLALCAILTLCFCDAQDIASGLRGHWSFTSSFDDQSGNGNHAINHGSIFVEDRNGVASSAISLNGANNYLDIGSSIDDLESTSSGSWSAWIKNSNPSNPAVTQMILSYSNNGSNIRFESHILAGSGKLRFLVIDGSVKWILETDDPIEADVWYHVAFVQDGVTPLIYINGALVPQTFTNSADNSYWFNGMTGSQINRGFISLREYSGFPRSGYFNGVIDDVRVYDRALTSEEVMELYNLTNGTSDNTESLWIQNGSDIYFDQGNVAIGNSVFASGYRLSVDGKVMMEEVKVQMSENWPDFVFLNDYKLKSLEDLEKFIRENRHLPEIPNEMEVLENGINLGEMNAKLLQKIEELTLYLIEEHKVNLMLKEEIELLKKEISVIKDN